MSLVFAIDPALRAGWAIVRGRRRLDSGVWDLNGEHPGDPCHKLLVHMNTVLGTLSEDPQLAFEQIHPRVFRSANNLRSQERLRGIVLLVAATWGLEVYTASITQIKACAGYGKASKDEMVDLAQLRWKHEVADDNEADALWIAETVRKRLRK